MSAPSHEQIATNRIAGRRVRRLLAHSAALSMVATALIGCTVLTSELPSALEQDGRAPEGVHYYLPKTVIDLTLSVDPEGATFNVTPVAVKTIADKGYRYYLRYVPLPQYHDTITVELHPEQGLLKLVSVDSTDKTVEIIENLAKLAGALNPGLLESASSQANAVQLTRISIDPADPEDLSRAAKLMNAEVHAFAQAQVRQKCTMKPQDREAGFILDVQRRAQCDAYRAVVAKRRHVALAFEPLHGFESRCKAPSASHHEHHTGPGPRNHAAHVPKRADCSVGICYRPVRPHELCIHVGDALARTIYEVPNASETVEIDIRRALLVNKTQVIAFGADGSLERMTVTKGSELLALSSLPLVVINALAKGLELRLTIVQNQVKLDGANKELAAARAKLEKQRSLLEAAAVSAGGRTSATSFSAVPKTSQFGSSAATQSGGTPFDKVKPLN